MADPTDNPYLDALAKEAGGTYSYIKPTTPSMLGSGYMGNYVIVVKKPEYIPDDDVLFRNSAGGNTLHRVTHVKPGYVFTKGTFNTNGDGWIPIGDVLGAVTKVVPKPKKQK